MNTYNNEKKIENVNKNEEEEIIDFERKKLINSKKINQEEIPSSHKLLKILKVFILIILLYHFSFFLNRIIKGKLLRDNTYLITSEKIFWKNSTKINFKEINEEISNYVNISINLTNKQDLIKRKYPKSFLNYSCI